MSSRHLLSCAVPGVISPVRVYVGFSIPRYNGGFKKVSVGVGVGGGETSPDCGSGGWATVPIFICS